ncbi:MAG: hypothetical protein OEX04_04270 [Acidimicrobiia bacterium]|nr:hypothetical protein [Acidimicrobiia bacterium]MDH5293490.1 hypothetical protein [Acidimicrobiia bacterium]
MRELATFTVLGVVILGLAAGLAIGGIEVHTVLIPLLVVFVSYAMGRLISWDEDRRFLAPMFAAGAVAKMLGSLARHWILFAQYGGIGDAVGYHNRGLEMADVWRTGAVPPIPEGLTSLGTRFTGWVTGLVYVPYKPSLLGGFFLFGALALFGQFLFYAAYRRWAPQRTWFRYLALILFWPTMVYWPSSIGKEAFLTLFIGLAAYGVSRLFKDYGFGWLIVFATGAGVVFVVREHVTALLVLSFLGTSLVMRTQPGTTGRRILLIGVLVAAMVPVAQGLTERFGVQFQDSVSAEDFDGIRADLERSTGQGGSAVTGGVITGPLDIPAGILKVLYRPLPNEATNSQMLIASFEGTALVLLTLWTSPRWLPMALKARAHPYLLFSIVYSFGFVIAWSWILNLGILARQRSLVVPFVLVLFAYGWMDRRPDLDTPLGAYGEDPVDLTPARP